MAQEPSSEHAPRQWRAACCASRPMPWPHWPTRMGPEFDQAVELILACHGRVIVSGIGKSGHIARKIAATMASTGTPAYFVHAAEAVHGDLGMITRDDVLIALSNSGENDELLTIVPLVKRQGGRLIAITGNAGLVAGQRGRRAPRCRRARGGLPAQPGADRQHHGGAGAGRCAGGCAARRTRLRRRGFRPLPSRRLARPQAADPRCAMSCARPTEVPTVDEATPVPEALLAMSRGGMGMMAVRDADGAPGRHLHRRRPAPRHGKARRPAGHRRSAASPPRSRAPSSPTASPSRRSR